MVPLQSVCLLFVALGALAVVVTQDVVRQAILFSIYGFSLVVLFVIFQAPDVALSALVVGGIAYPLVLVSALAAVMLLVIGLNVVSHGFITPGGGFQGGVILASAFAVVFLTVEYRAYREIATTSFGEPVEAFGAGAYVGLGLVALGFGLSFLQNFMELGIPGRLSSGGSAIFVNFSSALAVFGGFLVIFSEYIEENMRERHQ